MISKLNFGEKILWLTTIGLCILYFSMSSAAWSAPALDANEVAGFIGSGGAQEFVKLAVLVKDAHGEVGSRRTVFEADVARNHPVIFAQFGLNFQPRHALLQSQCLFAGSLGGLSSGYQTRVIFLEVG